MKILHITPSFYPATLWGGPIFSTKAVCDWTAQAEGFELEVITTDALAPGTRSALPLTNRRVRTDAGYDITYFPRQFRNSISLPLLRALPQAIREADIVHVTSTYSSPVLPALGLARLLGRPVVWSPRGAIQASAEWAQTPNKLAKLWFERVAGAIAPHRMVVHVTAAPEAKATATRLPGRQLRIVPNSVEIPADMHLSSREWRPNGRLRISYLSRIHQKKGLELLFQALSYLPAVFELHVYGHGSDEYVAELKQKAQLLDIQHRVNFCGHVDGVAKREAFRRSDLFVLPSYSENFGIVVAEALAHGVPVLTTTGTPWSDVAKRNCGVVVEPTVEHIRTALLELSMCPLSEMGQRGRDWMIADFSPEAVNRQMLNLYRELVDAI
jgi:glycosyltransferase involved in cell wall biosynthesis